MMENVEKYLPWGGMIGGAVFENLAEHDLHPSCRILKLMRHRSSSMLGRYAIHDVSSLRGSVEALEKKVHDSFMTVGGSEEAEASKKP
jgi:hypothetical protein